jgi:adsorption protein B
VLLSGLDDLALDAACFARWLIHRLAGEGPGAAPGDRELDTAPRKRIAVFVPLWREHRVICRMLEHNLAASRYPDVDYFAGAYANDGLTQAAVREVERLHGNVHLVICPHEGPTSKADCLNWIYQGMLRLEESRGAHFDIVVTHDAEDLIHPDALRWINYFAGRYDMVQIPVLALPTPFRELTHGVYCDEFAEFQIRDLPARQRLGGFIPSCGVGTGFTRAALEELARTNSGRIFEPSCLTEDYENGFRLHRLGRAQLFAGIHKSHGTFIATREYFPRTLRGAVRQRTRWITGIALQSWERHGWRDTVRQLYWFWRDRKGLVNNLVPPLSNLLFAYGAATWLWSAWTGRPWGLVQAAREPWLVLALYATLALQAFRMLFRACVSAAVYGWKFALGVPLRMVWGNYINCLATLCAYHRYFSAKLRGCPLVWIKTEHAYPSPAALLPHKRRLGEVLVASRYVTPSELENALSKKPANARLGEYLIQKGKLSERELYEALSLQQNVPLGKPGRAAVSRAVTRSFPAEIVRRWQSLPFRIAAGLLWVASPELPSDQMQEELHRFSSLEIHSQLVTPTEFQELAREYLP